VKKTRRELDGFKNAFYSYAREVGKKRLMSDEEEKDLGLVLKKIRDKEVLPYLKSINNTCKSQLAVTFDGEVRSRIRGILKLLPITLEKPKIVGQQKSLILFLFPKMVWRKGKPVWTKKTTPFKEDWESFIRGKNKLKLACNPLVESNLRLVINMAKAYINALNEIELMDLVQEGNLGMMRAALTWEYRQARFGTYAFYWIRQGITRVMNVQNDQQIYFPVHMNSTMQTVLNHARKLEQELERIPTEQELAKRAKLSVVRLKEIKEYIALKKSTVYLDAPMLDTDHSSLLELIPDEKTEDASEVLLHKQNLERIESIMSLRLSEKEIKVLKERFIDEKILSEIGDKRSLSRERIRQIEEKALEKLRHHSQIKNLLDLCENA